MVTIATTTVDVARSKWTVVFGKDCISDLLTLLPYHFNKGEIKKWYLLQTGQQNYVWFSNRIKSMGYMLYKWTTLMACLWWHDNYSCSTRLWYYIKGVLYW